MIKRRFYKLEHRDGDSLSSSSSSSSSSESEHEDDGRGVEEEEEKELAAVVEEREKPTSPSTASSGSGYESEDSSGDEINCDNTGLLVSDFEEDSGKDKQNLVDSQTKERRPERTTRFASTNITKAIDSKDSLQAEVVDYVLKCKSVFKCRICPRIVCLSEDTLLDHLRSKRHARSKKLLGEGRLKLMLNSDGEIEEEQETHAERHARIIALVEKPERKNKGRQRQRQRKKRKLRNGCADGKSKTNPPQKKQPTKRRKIED